MSIKVAKYIYFKFLFIVILVVFKVSSVTSAPASQNFQLLDDFMEYLKHTTVCQFPEEIGFPFDPEHDDTNPWKFLSTPLQICNNVSNSDTKVHFSLCSEVFDVLSNLSCPFKPREKMPHINVEIPIDKPICEHLKQKKGILVDKEEYIGKRLATDLSLCEIICSGEKMEMACRFLLWSYEVEKQVFDYEENINAATNHSSDGDLKSHNHLNGNTSVLLQETKIPVTTLQINGSHAAPAIAANQSINSVPDSASVHPGNEIIKTDDVISKKTDIKNNQNKFEENPESVNGEIAVKDKGLMDTNKQSGKTLENTSSHASDIFNNNITTGGRASTHIINTTSIQSSSNASMQVLTEKPTNTENTIPTENISDNEVEDIDSNQKPEENTVSAKELRQKENTKSKNSVPNPKSDQIPKNQKEDDSNLKVEMPQKIENVLPNDSGDAVKDDNELDVPEEYPKNNPDVQDISNALPSISPEDLYVEKTDPASVPGFKQELKPETFDKGEDKPDILLNRERDQSIDMENMERDFMGEFSSMEDGHSVNMNQPTFPDQDDSHFFFYFLTIIFMIMAGYLIFHNKQKIIALIVEGRHERRRRSHGVGYKKLDTK